MDQKDYPNEPGVGGIDFSNLKTGEIISASGARIQAEVGYGFISLKDKDKELTAEVDDDGNLKLRAFTKDRETGIKHPDLYATKFIELALSHFEKQGIRITAFKDRWNEDTDNFEKFHDVLNRTGSKIEAALSNLPMPLIKRGFTDISDEDILVGNYKAPDSQQPSFVVATFQKGLRENEN